MEVTTRTNFISLVKLKLKSTSVLSLVQFRGLIEELFEELSTFEKFSIFEVKNEVVEEVVQEEVDRVVSYLLDDDDSVEELPDPEMESSVEEIFEEPEKNHGVMKEEDEIRSYRLGKQPLEIFNIIILII